MRQLVVQAAWVIFGLWLLGGLLTLLSLLRLKFLKPSTDARLKKSDAPLVSILVPARNEERRILRECLRSILAQDYANFEVVAVNDRSTDATSAILRELASGDERLRVVEGAETPRGWLGKPYALQQALEASRGEWVLMADADMIFHPAALRTAVAYVSERDADALSYIPHFEARSFWERVFVPVWGWGFLILYPLDIVNHARSPLAVGIGGFFLIRRASLAPLGGFAAVRDEVLDDFRLAGYLKKSGARAFAEYAPDLARTRMYTNLAELWESATKNWFAIVRFSLALATATLAWIFFIGILPALLAALSALVIALGSADETWRRLFVPTFLTWIVTVLVTAAVNRAFRVPARYALTMPLGWALCCAVLIGSAFGVATGRGLNWKGRKFYEHAGVSPPKGKAGRRRSR
ncbi:MAG TPA: glycosyltransferase [Pyrinomonadaceae bacterium]|nr:glycosyltransferase [Pyrinomonadaceae bacterium]